MSDDNQPQGTAMSDLLPCPFCNTSPEANNLSTVHPVNREKTFWVFNCLEEIGGCGASMIGDSKKDAIDKWNTRTLMSSQPPFAYATHGAGLLPDHHSQLISAEETDDLNPACYTPVFAAPPQAQGDVGFGGQPLVVDDDPSALGKLERFLQYVHLTIDSLDVPENVLDEIYCEARELVKELNLKRL